MERASIIFTGLAGVARQRPSISNVRVYNSSTRNCDPHILLIVTGNGHKESCHKLSLIFMREQGLIKTDCSGKMVVAFTIKEKNYLMVSPFCHMVLPLSYLY